MTAELGKFLTGLAVPRAMEFQAQPGKSQFHSRLVSEMSGPGPIYMTKGETEDEFNRGGRG